jgi:NDP-sugar pyrophosphorylase family protein
MGGQGIRFKQAGYKDPKPFVSVLGQPMIKRLLNLFPSDWPAVFVLNNQDYSEVHTYKLSQFRNNSLNQFIFIDPNSGGPLKTVIAGLEKIPDHAPVFVSYCDYGMIWDANRLLKFVEKNNSDICFVSYKGFHAHYLSPNMYCYTKTDGNKVLDIKEKECFSESREDDYASTGGYYFKSAGLLKQAVAEQIKQDLNWRGEYFTSLAAKALMNVRSDLNVHVYEISKFFQWGTPEDLKAFEYWAEVDYASFKK